MDTITAPLADYFWIAGVDSISYGEAIQGPWSHKDKGAAAAAPQVDATIEENAEEGEEGPALIGTPRSVARHSRTNSANRLSRISDARLSIQTLEEIKPGTASNRSSVTIKAVPTTNGNGFENTNGGLFGDFDFDQALQKFAKERESFLDDLSFSAGTVPQDRPPMTNRAEKLKYDEMDAHTPKRSPLKSVGGSIRRKISFRDMNSVKRQASVVSRANSVRTAKRLSNYNSVIPPPEPLNPDPDMHPLKRRFEPVLLDRYPPRQAQDEIKRRGKFPDFVPMFAFPNDVNIVSADERPRATWHGFTMTGEDNSKIYGICVVVWTPLDSEAASKVERRCEEWRQSHMTNEERELASSLGERLALERAHLSKLLAQLPTVLSGSAAREALEEQISATEEKIGLMADMLRPVRHAAAAKIEGLTDGETGLWSPRAYGVLGHDANLTSFWKEWLRAVVVPMTDGAVLRISPSSPRVGRWQPLERYVVNLCTEALSPITSKTQVDIMVRELHLYARKEATNEVPGSRDTDLFALFRCLSIPNIVALFEFALSESRIIFLSSHTAMLHLACKALASLLYPMTWASIYIPVLPARLISALEAPCPYIVGIERRYERVDLPEDDYVLVDLDQDSVEATALPPSLPRQQRRKLISLLQLAAPHHNRFGVPTGPPPYAMEAFPYDSFSSENTALFNSSPPPTYVAKYVGENSTAFGDVTRGEPVTQPIFNAFAQAKPDANQRPSTSRSTRISPPSSLSPASAHSGGTSNTRNDSGYALTATLREKRSGHFDSSSRRSSSFALDRRPTLRSPNAPFQGGHSASHSTSSLSIADSTSTYGYAPSTYAASTIAASTIMPNMLMQTVNNTDDQVWVEGHCLQWVPHDVSSPCSICESTPQIHEDDGIYKCSNCPVTAHSRCLGHVSLVCPAAFHADKVRAAFLRCFASLFYTYRKFMKSPNSQQKAAGQIYSFDMEAFMRSVPGDQEEFLRGLQQTQAFNEFIHERETTSSSADSIRIFDSIIMAKRNRGRTPTAFFGSKKSSFGSNRLFAAAAGNNISNKAIAFLEDTTDHLWRNAAVPTPTASFTGDYRTVVSRMPSKLDPTLMKEPRVILGQPRAEKKETWSKRKAVPSMLGLPKDKGR